MYCFAFPMYLRWNPENFWPHCERLNFVLPAARLERKNGVQMRIAAVPNAIKSRTNFVIGVLLAPLQNYLVYYPFFGVLQKTER